MSEDLEELARLGLLLLRNKKWDGVIEVCTEIIRLEEVPERKAGAYNYRGAACTAKKDYDRAIADYDKAINLNSQDPTVYLARGHVYLYKRDYDRAIADFDKAIGLNPHCAEAYHMRALGYRSKGGYDRAITDFDKVIELNPQYAEAYRGRALVYHIKGNHDRAIADFNKAIELNQRDALAYYLRGLEYRYKGDYASALDDFLEAGNQDKSLKSNYVLVYIAYSLEGITSDRDEQAGLFKSYWALANAIHKISTALFYDFKDAKEVAHYTSLHGLRALAETDKPFRLYNSAYMNDPTEGRVFFEIMKEIMKDEKDEIDVKETFYKTDSDSHSSPAYIGSFVKTDSRNGGRKDKLLLWRAYGKHDTEAAGGACLIFQKDQFAQQVPEMEIGAMPQLKKDAAKQGETLRQDLRPALYRVIYNYKESDKSESENGPNLAALLKELASRLNDMAKLLKSPEIHKEKFTQLVRELLDSIRFLFKADSYSEEQEVRVVRMLYDTDGHTPPGRKVAIDRMPPRFYLEVPGNFRFNEVILGPKVGNVSEWQQWMNENNGITVEKSKIPFR